MSDIDEIERSARALLAADPDDFETASREYREAASAANVLALTAELRRLQEDAERYRWLRDFSEPGICAFYLSVGQAFKGVRFKRETVDAAIDAARQKVTA